MQSPKAPTGEAIQFTCHTITGSVPKNNASINTPKANPGSSSHSFVSSVSVIGIVILNRRIDRYPAKGIDPANNARTPAPPREITDAAETPNLSAANHPRAFPATIHPVKINPVKKVWFQE